jgi:hypothetical protein
MGRNVARVKINPHSEAVSNDRILSMVVHDFGAMETRNP